MHDWRDKAVEGVNTPKTARRVKWGWETFERAICGRLTRRIPDAALLFLPVNFQDTS